MISEIIERLKTEADWRAVLSDYTIYRKKRMPLNQRLLETLRRHPDLSMSALQNHLRPHTKAAVFDAVQELCELGHVVKAFSTDYGKNTGYATFRISGHE